jgi:hypothetical protein
LCLNLLVAIKLEKRDIKEKRIVAQQKAIDEPRRAIREPRRALRVANETRQNDEEDFGLGIFAGGAPLDCKPGDPCYVILHDLPILLVHYVLAEFYGKPFEGAEDAPITVAKISEIIESILEQYDFISSSKGSTAYKNIKKIIDTYATIFEIYIPNMLAYQQNFSNYIVNSSRILSILEHLSEYATDELDELMHP